MMPQLKPNPRKKPRKLKRKKLRLLKPRPKRKKL